MGPGVATWVLHAVQLLFAQARSERGLAAHHSRLCLQQGAQQCYNYTWGVHVVCLVRVGGFLSREGGRVKVFDGVGFNLAGAQGGVTKTVSSLLSDINRVGSSLCARLRRLLIVRSIKIRASLRVVRRLHGHIPRGGVGGPAVIGSRVGRVITRGLCNNRSVKLVAVPSVVFMVNIGNMNGAAAVNGLTTVCGSRNGGIVLKTTSAFHTTTVSRLRV